MLLTKGVRAGNRAMTKVGVARYVEIHESRQHAEGPDEFDCSGLVRWAYLRYGIDLPHSAAAQRHATSNVRRYQDLLPGDLVFYYSVDHPTHVSIYLGRTGVIGRRKYWVVQATNEKRGIERIQMNQYTHAVSYGRVPGADRLA